MKNAMLIWVLLWFWCAHAQDQRPAPSLTLEQAWQLAERDNLSLAVARADLTAAAGRAADASGLLWNNPEIAAEATRRRTPQPDLTTTTREWAAGISQPFEVAGQHGHRRDAARLEVEAARYRADEALRQLRADVERRFVQVLSLQARVANERRALRLLDDTASLAGRRVDVGEDSRLDGNFAQVEAGRARNQLAALEDQVLQARAELAEIVQWPQSTLPEPAGELERGIAVAPLAQLLASAADRAQLRALQSRESAARSRLDLERAARYPDVTLGLVIAREGPSDVREKLATLTVSLPLPLFKRNAGNVAQAQADLDRARAERVTGERDIPATVRTLWLRMQGLQSRVEALRETVLRKLEQNEGLSRKALAEGEIGVTQLVLVNRQVLDSRRDLIDALTELRLARIALDLAAGQPR